MAEEEPLPGQHAIARTACPECGWASDEATNAVDDRPPMAGALSLCPNCAAILVFGDGLVLRRATPTDLRGFPLEHLKGLMETRRLYREAIAREAGRN